MMEIFGHFIGFVPLLRKFSFFTDVKPFFCVKTMFSESISQKPQEACLFLLRRVKVNNYDCLIFYLLFIQENWKIASIDRIFFQKSSMFGTSFMQIQCVYFLTIIYVKLPECSILLTGMLSRGIKKALSHESLNQ